MSKQIEEGSIKKNELYKQKESKLKTDPKSGKGLKMAQKIFKSQVGMKLAQFTGQGQHIAFILPCFHFLGKWTTGEK